MLGLWVVYALFLPLTLAAGMAPMEAGFLFLKEALAALDPVLVFAIGSLLLYLCGVAVPPADAIDRGRCLALYGHQRLRMLRIG